MNVQCLWGDMQCLWGDVQCLWADVQCLWADMQCLWGDVQCLLGDMQCLWADAQCLWADLSPGSAQMWPDATSSVQDSEFYKSMKVAEGCEKGFVHILDSQEAVERICTRQADYVKVWAPFMQPNVARLLCSHSLTRFLYVCCGSVPFVQPSCTVS
jgi:hypothetical protein